MFIKNSVLVLGIVFVLIGLLGFFNNPIIGLFSVNALHDLIHLVSGILAIIFAVNSEKSARVFSQVFGVVYALVAILGFAAPMFMAKLLNINTADNWLHVVLALVFLGLGFLTKTAMAESSAS
jgi:uncharacterized membrane protein HdeD (DUF308 family)